MTIVVTATIVNHANILRLQLIVILKMCFVHVSPIASEALGITRSY